MSAERKIEISINIIVLIFTILANIGAVIWFAAEVKTELYHIKKDVIHNSERIMKLSEFLMDSVNEK